MTHRFDKDSLLSFLESLGVSVECFEHPAVFTTEEAREHLQGVPGRATKNLFLRDEKGKRHFLLAVEDQKQVDLKGLSKVLELKALSLASPERLETHLGVKPGAVTLLALLNDEGGKVELLLDNDLADADALQCHPLVNTATLVVPTSELIRVLKKSGHEARLLNVPTRN